MPITGEGQCLLAHTSERPCYQADYSKLYSTILMIKLIITCNIIYISVGQWLVCEWIHLNNLLLVKMPRHVILMIDTVWSSTDEWQGPGPPNSRESATPRIPTGIPKNYWILRGNLRKFQKVTNLVNFCSGFWKLTIMKTHCSSFFLSILVLFAISVIHRRHWYVIFYLILYLPQIFRKSNDQIWSESKAFDDGLISNW